MQLSRLACWQVRTPHPPLDTLRRDDLVCLLPYALMQLVVELRYTLARISRVHTSSKVSRDMAIPPEATKTHRPPPTVETLLCSTGIHPSLLNYHVADVFALRVACTVRSHGFQMAVNKAACLCACCLQPFYLLCGLTLCITLQVRCATSCCSM